MLVCKQLHHVVRKYHYGNTLSKWLGMQERGMASRCYVSRDLLLRVPKPRHISLALASMTHLQENPLMQKKLIT